MKKFLQKFAQMFFTFILLFCFTGCSIIPGLNTGGSSGGNHDTGDSGGSHGSGNTEEVETDPEFEQDSQGNYTYFSDYINDIAGVQLMSIPPSVTDEKGNISVKKSGNEETDAQRERFYANVYTQFEVLAKYILLYLWGQYGAGIEAQTITGSNTQTALGTTKDYGSDYSLHIDAITPREVKNSLGQTIYTNKGNMNFALYSIDVTCDNNGEVSGVYLKMGSEESVTGAGFNYTLVPLYTTQDTEILPGKWLLSYPGVSITSTSSQYYPLSMEDIYENANEHPQISTSFNNLSGYLTQYTGFMQLRIMEIVLNATTGTDYKTSWNDASVSADCQAKILEYTYMFKTLGFKAGNYSSIYEILAQLITMEKDSSGQYVTTEILYEIYNVILYEFIGENKLNADKKELFLTHEIKDYTLYVDETYTDTNGNGKWDPAEKFTDINGNGIWDEGEGFYDANGNGKYDKGEFVSTDDTNVTVDANGDLIQVGAIFTVGSSYDSLPSELSSSYFNDENENGVYDTGEYITGSDTNFKADTNGNIVKVIYHVGDTYDCRYGDTGVFDAKEYFEDTNNNGTWDDAEPFEDFNKNGIYDENTLVIEVTTENGVQTLKENGVEIENTGEYFTDLNGNGVWDEGEPFEDWNKNGVWDDKLYVDINLNGQYDDVNNSGTYNESDGCHMTDSTGILPWNALYERIIDVSSGKIVIGGIEISVSDFQIDYEGISIVISGNQALIGYVPAVLQKIAVFVDGEPFTDANNNGEWDTGEAFEDTNGNETYDAGFIKIHAREAQDLTSKEFFRPGVPAEDGKRRTLDNMDYAQYKSLVFFPTEDNFKFDTLTMYVDSETDFSMKVWMRIHLSDEKDYFVPICILNLDSTKDADWPGEIVDDDSVGNLDDDDTSDESWTSIEELFSTEKKNAVWLVELDQILTAEEFEAISSTGVEKVLDEKFTDTNGNGKWDEGEPFEDTNGNGICDRQNYQGRGYHTNSQDNLELEDLYQLMEFGETYTDTNGNGVWDEGEPFEDTNGNGICDHYTSYAYQGGGTFVEFLFEIIDEQPDTQYNFKVLITLQNWDVDDPDLDPDAGYDDLDDEDEDLKNEE